MNLWKITRQDSFLWKKCPFCFGELGKVELLRRKLNKICRCKNCGKIIDERNLVR